MRKGLGPQLPANGGGGEFQNSPFQTDFLGDAARFPAFN
jgi:hypothetical protein